MGGNQIQGVEDTFLCKMGGADLNSTFGTRMVASGSAEWNVRVDALGTSDNSNVMIGVAHPDVPLDFVQMVWRNQAGADDHATKLAYVKSPGNTTRKFGSTFGFGAGDVITVVVDVDNG